MPEGFFIRSEAAIVFARISIVALPLTIAPSLKKKNTLASRVAL